MSTPVAPIQSLKIDETTYNVADQSTEVKQLVSLCDQWNQDKQDAEYKVAQLQAALNELYRQIILQIKKDEQSKTAANDPTTTAPVTPVVTEPSTTVENPSSTVVEPTAKE